MIEIDEGLVQEAARAFQTKPDAVPRFKNESYWDELEFFHKRSWRMVAEELEEMVSGSEFLMSDAMLYYYLPGFLVGIVCRGWGRAGDLADSLPSELDPSREWAPKSPEFFRLFTAEERAFVFKSMMRVARSSLEYDEPLELSPTFVEFWSR